MIITPFAPSLINPLKPRNEIMRKSCANETDIEGTFIVFNIYIYIHTFNILIYIFFKLENYVILCTRIGEIKRDLWFVKK